MGIKLAAIAALVVALGAGALYFPMSTTPAQQQGLETPGVTLAIGTDSTSSPQATVVAEVADTDKARSRGLGGRTELAEGRGMWFVFGQDDTWGFWMKDTLIPLDIIWVAADGTIVTIAHEVKPESYPRVFYPVVPARYVLEVPGGFALRRGIAEGQQVVVQ